MDYKRAVEVISEAKELLAKNKTVESNKILLNYINELHEKIEKLTQK